MDDSDFGINRNKTSIATHKQWIKDYVTCTIDNPEGVQQPLLNTFRKNALENKGY